MEAEIDKTWKQAWMVAFGQHANLDADVVDATARSTPAPSGEDAAQVVRADFNRHGHTA